MCMYLWIVQWGEAKQAYTLMIPGSSEVRRFQCAQCNSNRIVLFAAQAIAPSVAHSYLGSGPRWEVSHNAWNRRLAAYIAWLTYLIIQAVADLSRIKEGSTEEGISPVYRSVNKPPAYAISQYCSCVMREHVPLLHTFEQANSSPNRLVICLGFSVSVSFTLAEKQDS
jgi:hypothetical protein